jgi:uncharacterized protein (DUF488 family)
MSKTINVYTIGFTQKTAEQFFNTLLNAGVKRVVDTRLNNVSQLAGFAKRVDLAYFLERIGGIEYVHLPQLAPTQDMLDAYKKQKGDWKTYEQQFMQLMHDRQIQHQVSPKLLDSSCLLCSEAKPHHCHRRLVAEYLQAQWGTLNIHHL